MNKLFLYCLVISNAMVGATINTRPISLERVGSNIESVETHSDEITTDTLANDQVGDTLDPSDMEIEDISSEGSIILEIDSILSEASIALLEREWQKAKHFLFSVPLELCTDAQLDWHDELALISIN